jgi:hypothetical protein
VVKKTLIWSCFFPLLVKQVEGILCVGGRTYFGRNDPWRICGYTAYGFDDKFKYGLSGKWMVDKEKNHTIGGK